MVSKDGSLTDVMVAGLSPGHCLTSQDEETGLRRKILSTCEESLVNFDDLCGTTLASPRTSDLPDVMCLYDLWGSIIERRPAFASKFVTWLEANPDMQRAQAAAIASIRPARTLEIDHLAVQYCLEHELITPEMKLYVQGQLSHRPPLEALADLFPKQAGIMYDDPVMSATPMQNISAGLDRYPIVTFQVALLFCSPRTPVGIATLIRALKTAKVKTLVMAACRSRRSIGLLYTSTSTSSTLTTMKTLRWH
jgi:hypothetical protein